MLSELTDPLVLTSYKYGPATTTTINNMLTKSTAYATKCVQTTWTKTATVGALRTTYDPVTETASQEIF